MQMVMVGHFVEVCKKGDDERIDESVLCWSGHIERMENNRIAKRVYMGESGTDEVECY